MIVTVTGPVKWFNDSKGFNGSKSFSENSKYVPSPSVPFSPDVNKGSYTYPVTLGKKGIIN